MDVRLKEMEVSVVQQARELEITKELFVNDLKKAGISSSQLLRDTCSLEKQEAENLQELEDLKQELVTSLGSGCADIVKDQLRHQNFDRCYKQSFVLVSMQCLTQCVPQA